MLQITMLLLKTSHFDKIHTEKHMKENFDHELVKLTSVFPKVGFVFMVQFFLVVMHKLATFVCNLDSVKTPCDIN